MSPSRRCCSGTSYKHSSIIFELRIRLAIPPVLKEEIGGIQSSLVPATEARTPQVLAGTFRENLSDQPAEQPRSEQPELPLKEKRSEQSEVTTTGIINQLDSPQARDNFESFLLIYLGYFREKMLSFKAGKLASHFSEWQSLTSDPEILETVSGCKIEFDTIPSLNKVMVHAVLSETQTESVGTEVSNLLRKQEIEACDHEAGEYISTIFTWPKKDGSHRMILNLKVPKQKYFSPSFQDGYSVNCCSTNETWVLYSVHRSKRCLLFSINTLWFPNVPKIQLEKPVVQVSLFP